MRKFIFGLIILGILNAAANAQKNAIRQVDFQNFSYQPVCGGGIEDEPFATVTVKNGKFENTVEEKGVTRTKDESLPTYFDAEVKVYGDVDGDGRDEAIVISTCNTGGTGNPTEGYVFTLKDGKPFLLARIEGGDRAYGSIREIKIVKGIVTVDRNEAGIAGANCCAEFAVISKYQWNGTTLAEFGTPISRRLIPVKLVKFAKGKSSGTLKLRIKTGETEHFGFTASENQTITIKTTPAAIILPRFGDLEIITDTPGLMRLTTGDKGDFTFEIGGDKSGEYVVNIEIK